MLDDLNARQQEIDDQFVPGSKCHYPTPSSSTTSEAIYFESGDEITLFQQQTQTYPVVEKREDRYVLVESFAKLADARFFIQGTHYLIWYRAEFP